ncbi:MAG: hypothetical protein EOP53_18285 [Sphingobacteriales bacterium]|nr:MAG: hypothetical protein EOP53_18285 [Sphingobacteriales bacterium]
MKKLFAAFTILLLVVGSCRKDSNLPLATNTITQDAKVTEAKEKLVTFIKAHNYQPRFNPKAARTQNQKSYSKNYIDANLHPSGNADFNHYQETIDKVINPDDYDCGLTIVDEYVGESISDWTDDDFTLFYYFGGVSLDYAYIFANKDGGQSYGSTGQFTNSLNRTYKSLLRFWDIPTDILMRDAHGTIYNDTTKVVSVLLLYGYPQEDASYIADLLKTALGSAAFDYYNHPLLTFNAFAAPADDYWGTPKKIVMGDGIMQAYADMGFSDIAAQGILAHEYGHQVQFANDVEFVFDPEGTRRTELMADAFAAYFLTHKQGATANWKRVKEFLAVFYAIGDCAFDNPNHHGTPNQRLKAATFGYNLANDAKTKGKILKSADIIVLFDAALADIVSPD